MAQQSQKDKAKYASIQKRKNVQRKGPAGELCLPCVLRHAGTWKQARKPSRHRLQKLNHGSTGILRVYLLAYNLASLAGWAYVLFRLFDHLSTMSSSFTWASLFPHHQEHRALVARASTSYADFGDVVRWVQTSAILEVVHVALGFVRSGLGTTASQVASRLILVWGILLQFPIVSIYP